MTSSPVERSSLSRTANTLSDERVGDAQLRENYELAKFGPTSANISPLRILFLRPGEGRRRLLPLLNEGNRAKTATAPIVAILADDHTFHERIPELLPFRPELREVFAADDERREKAARYHAPAVDTEFFGGTDLHSQLVVNIGKPGPDPWFDRLPRLAYEDAVSFG